MYYGKLWGSTEPGTAGHLTRCVMEGTKWTSGQALEEITSPIENVGWLTTTCVTAVVFRTSALSRGKVRVYHKRMRDSMVEISQAISPHRSELRHPKTSPNSRFFDKCPLCPLSLLHIGADD